MTELGVAYLKGSKAIRSGPDSVACTSKHFPGGGPQKDGEDAHFPYGREQVYPGGRFADHLEPFPPVIEAGHRARIMPYYGMPVGLERRRRGDRGGRLRLQPAGRHRPAARAARLRRRRASRTGSWSTTTTSATRCCPPAPGASSTSTRTGGWSCILARRCRPVRRRGVRRRPARPRRAGPGHRGARRRVGPPPAGGEVPARAVRRPLRRRGRRRRAPWVAPTSARPGYAAQARSVTVLHNGSDGCRPAPARPAACASTPRACRRRGGRRGTACPVDGPEDADVAVVRLDGAVRAALGPVPRVVVPPGLARLPARPRRPAARGSPPSARSSSTSCSTGRPSSTPLLPFASAVVGSYGTQRRRPARRPHRDHRRPRAGCRSTSRARWSRCARTARTCRASTTRCSPSVTG